MKSCYRFGKFTVAVDAAFLLPYVCEDFRVDVTDTPYLIRIRQTHSTCSSPKAVHWAPCPEDGPGFYAFFEGGQALFSLRRAPGASVVDAVVHQLNLRILMQAMQYALMLLLNERCLGLHCATVRYGDTLAALSAPSGTGKTTLAGLLEKRGVEIVNGDFALFSIEDDGQILFEPTPFCGSSGVCLNQRMPLSRLVFLSQEKQTRVLPMPFPRLLTALLSNSFVPEWDSEAADNIRCSAVRLAKCVPAAAFPFAPDDAAAETFLRELP